MANYGTLDIAFDRSSMVGAGLTYLGDASVSVRLKVNVLSQSVETKSAQVQFILEAYKLNNAFYNYESVIGYLYANTSYIAVNGKSAGVDSEYGIDVSVNTTGGEYAGYMTGKWYQELQKTLTLWKSGTYTIYYDKDDVANVSFNATFSFELRTEYGLEQSTWYAAVDDVQYSVNFDLPDLPRYAAISSAPTSFTDEANPTISYSVPKGTTNIQLGILFSDGTVAVPYRTVSDSSGNYTFNFTDEERASLYSILSKGISSTSVLFSIKSYYPDTNTNYSKTKSSTLSIINYKPTIDPELWDFNPVTVALTTGTNATKSYKIVKYFSTVAYDIRAEGHKGASIASISVKNGDRTNTLTNGTFDNIISSLFTFAATDTFGRATEPAEMELSPTNWVEYVKLTSNISLSDMAADGDVKVTVTGKYFNGSFGATNNAVTFTYTAVPTRGDTITGTASVESFYMDGNNYTATFTISGLSYSNAYSITVTATDKLMSAVSGSDVVAPEPLFDWGREDFNFNIPVNVNGEITAQSIKINGYTVPTIVEQGTTASGWTYRKWSDGVAECWTSKTFTGVAVTNAWGSMYASGAISGSNLTFPTNLFVATPTVNTSLATGSLGGILMAPGGTGSNTTSKTNTGILEIARGTSSTGAFVINYDVKGRWK